MDLRRIPFKLPFRTRRGVFLAWCGLGGVMGLAAGLIAGEYVAGAILGLVLGAGAGGYIASKRSCALRRASGVAIARPPEANS